MLAEFGDDGYGMPKVKFGFNSKMTHLCGQIAHIKSIRGGRILTIEGIEDDPLRGSWSISTDMIRLYDESDESPVEFSDWECFMNG